MGTCRRTREGANWRAEGAEGDKQVWLHGSHALVMVIMSGCCLQEGVDVYLAQSYWVPEKAVLRATQCLPLLTSVPKF